jgi:dTDP-L-rhamnose 4-epimerase
MFHQAATVGVGQSMYKIAYYSEVNILGTANLLDILANERNGVTKIIMASSMSNYGEGKYYCEGCGTVHPRSRSRRQLERREWEMTCPHCYKYVRPVPTDEEKPLYPTSVYAISKRDQEEMVINVGRAYNIPAVALRYFNTYGPRQALSNPYTGVAAIFSSRIINGHNPVIFEDGLQGRDFIHVSDVVQANILAMERDEANYEVFNVGTGKMTKLLEMVEILIKKLGHDRDIRPEITNKFREGDIRCCYADISKIEKKLGFKPKVKFKEGLFDLIDWVMTQTSADTFEEARAELESHRLTQ